MTRAILTRRPRAAWTNDPLFRRLERLFDEDLFEPVGQRGEATVTPEWTPPVDVRETQDAYLFSAELAGLSRDDVEITFEDRVLTFAGERKLEPAEERNSFHRIERSYGSFSRSFTLPAEIDPAKVEAKFDNGVLTIRVPKVEAAKPRRIEIR